MSEIVALAKRRLAESGYPELAALACKSESGCIVLTGVVSSFYMKALAQERVKPLGVPVKNQIKVK